MPAVTISLAMRAGSVCDPVDAPGRRLSAVAGARPWHGDAVRGGHRRRSRQPRHHADDCRHAPYPVARVHLSHRGFRGRVRAARRHRHVPVVPGAELGIRKAEVITAIRQDEDNPAVRAVESLMALLYPDGHPYGRRTKGTVDGVEALTRERLVRLHAERFAPSELTAVVVGDVPAGRAIDVAARVFGDWRVPPPAPIALPRVVPADRRQRLVIPMMNKAQADVAYGFTTIARRDPAYYACVADEQRARAVFDGRPARRQHSRAAGDGLLRVQQSRCERRRRSADHPRRRQPGERRSRRVLDRRRGRPSRAGGHHGEGVEGITAVPDRVDAARARDQRRNRELSPDDASSSASASTTTCGCRTVCGP